MAYNKSSFDLGDFFDAALKRSYGDGHVPIDVKNEVSKTKHGKYNSSIKRSRQFSGLNNSIIYSAMHGGGLYEAYDINPSINAVRRAASMRNKDMRTKYRFEPTKTPGFHTYMKKIGFGDRKYIMSRAAQNVIARAASSEASRDKNRKPYAYYVKKQQGFL